MSSFGEKTMPIRTTVRLLSYLYFAVLIVCSLTVPFLPVRDDFHPKRNQARQKLATLPTSRFKDLSSDVYYELVRRYPEFKEEEVCHVYSFPWISQADANVIQVVEKSIDSPGSTYDDYPSPDFPATSRSSQTDTQTTITPIQPVPTHRANGSISNMPRASLPTSPPLPPTPYTSTTSTTDYPSPGPVLHSSQDAYSTSSPDVERTRLSQDSRSPADPSSRRRPSDDYSTSSRRRPSEDYRRPSEDFYSGGRRPSASSNGTGTSNTNANMATSGVVIPAKSTIAEEDIEVPFARRGGRSDGDDRDRNQDDNIGYGGLSRRLGSTSGGRSIESASDDDDDDDDDESFDKMSIGRGSVVSERGVRAGSDRERGGRASGGGSDGERVRREYEFRIATMQSKIVGLEREAEERIGVLDDYRRVRRVFFDCMDPNSGIFSRPRRRRQSEDVTSMKLRD
jgi:hypothetical protein